MSKYEDLKISNELLSNVLSIEVHSNSLSFDSIIFECSLPLEQKVSLYKFAFLCKEWAFSQGFTVLTEFVKQNGVFSYIVSNKQSIEDYGYLENVKVLNYNSHNKTEPEAIIQACEWILSQDVKK